MYIYRPMPEGLMLSQTSDCHIHPEIMDLYMPVYKVHVWVGVWPSRKSERISWSKKTFIFSLVMSRNRLLILWKVFLSVSELLELWSEHSLKKKKKKKILNFICNFCLKHWCWIYIRKLWLFCSLSFHGFKKASCLFVDCCGYMTVTQILVNFLLLT